MKDASDLELLHACIDGDRRAWAVFVERFTRYVYYLVPLAARRYSVQLSEAEVADLHNDVFLALLEDDRRRLRAFRGRNGCSVRSWIRIIAIRRTLDALRKRRPEISFDAMLQDPDRPAVQLADPGPDPLEIMLRDADDQRRERLRELAARLRPADRLLLELIYSRELSVEAIAASLRVSRGAVYTRKNRLIGRLRALAEEAGLVEPARSRDR